MADPQIEFHSAMTVPGGAVYHGHDGLRKWLGDLEDAWGDELRVEPEVFFDVGEHTLAFQVLHGRGRQSGAEVALPAAALARWRDGLMVSFKTYAHAHSRSDVLPLLRLDSGAMGGDGLEPPTSCL
jgi:ketosteroid isomerase-like protein